MRRGYNKRALYDAIALGNSEGLGSHLMARLLGVTVWYARHLRMKLALPPIAQPGRKRRIPSQRLLDACDSAKAPAKAVRRDINQVDSSANALSNRTGVG